MPPRVSYVKRSGASVTLDAEVSADLQASVNAIPVSEAVVEMAGIDVPDPIPASRFARRHLRHRKRPRHHNRDAEACRFLLIAAW